MSSEMNQIINPLNSTNNISIKDESSDDNINITKLNITKYYKHIYILCPKSNEELTGIYDINISKDLYNALLEKTILYKTSINIIKNPVHFSNIKLVDKECIEKANIFGYPLDDKILLLTIFNISFLNLRNYLDNLEENNGLKNLYDTLVINDYFGNNTKTNYKNNMYLQKLINNIKELDYWSNPFHCKLNMSNEFKKRKFNISKFTSIDKNLTELFDNLNKLEIKDNYIEGIFKFRKYCDPSNIIEKKGYKLYYIENNNDFTKDDIYNIMLKLDPENAFNLFCKLLISKKYCHLVFYSPIFELLDNHINTYMDLIKYLLGYAWLRFYMEESIKKSNLKTDDQIIFTLDIASKLPVFPVNSSNSDSNPYLPHMISNNVLNPVDNINGVTNCNNNADIYNHRICNLQEFQDRLNIFISGSKYINFFEGFDFQKNKMAITGSIMTACLQYRHPLMSIFTSPDSNNIESILYRYFNEYYCESDIDIMIKTEDHFDFFDISENIFNQIHNKISQYKLAEGQILSKQLIKTNYIFISEEFIKEKLVTETLTYEEIISNLDHDIIKNLLYPYITKIHSDKINEQFKDFSPDETDNIKRKYPYYFILNLDDIKIRLSSKNKKLILSNIKGNIDISKKHNLLVKDPFEESNKELDDDINYDSSSIGIVFNFKVKLSSPWLDHSFEIFPIRGDDYFGVVNTFHLPCVRSYYDGLNVYMTPSCISAHLTFMNLNYKYVAGTKDPLDIINKYRMRGFGTFLNNLEIKLYIKYIVKTKFWNNLFNIDINNQKSYKTVLGYLNLNHKLFHPRLYNADYYNENSNIRYIDQEEFNYNINENFDSESVKTQISATFLQIKYNSIDFSKYFKNKHFQCFKTGYILPCNSSIINYLLDNYKCLICSECNKPKNQYDSTNTNFTCNKCFNNGIFTSKNNTAHNILIHTDIATNISPSQDDISSIPV